MTQEATEVSELVGILDDVLGFAEDSLTEYKNLQQKNADLQLKVAQSDRVVLEKVASVVMPDQAIQQTMDRLIELHYLTPKESVKLAADIRRQPSILLNLLTKVAEASLSVPGEGSGIAKSASEIPSGKDPDGWDDMAAGKPVKEKRY